MEFVPFELEHLEQIGLAPQLLALSSSAMRVPELSYSGRVGELIVGAAGIVPQWTGRAIAWAAFSPFKRREWPVVTRKVESVLAIAHARGYRRIEAYVAGGFPAAHRWIRRLGFELETPDGMKGWDPDGLTYFMYARVR